MIRTLNGALLALALSVGAAHATTVPVDLTNWSDDSKGGASWNIQPGNDAVLQTVNGEPTTFFAPGTNAQGTALSGRISVQTPADDDFIGFVLGYQDNELFSSTSNYILVDWKQLDQNFGSSGFAPAGLSISHVTDSANGNFWDHSDGVTEIERATNLGSTGWADNTEYEFDIIFNANLIQVFVDGVLELNTTAGEAGLGAFDNGAFGFYNYSQANVLYSALEEREAPADPGTIPAPASLLLMGMGLAALGMRRRRR
ncbi:MAG: PEP-CTERM sorting domain-containing protein [Sphingomonadales bacterium]